MPKEKSKASLPTSHCDPLKPELLRITCVTSFIIFARNTTTVVRLKKPGNSITNSENM